MSADERGRVVHKRSHTPPGPGRSDRENQVVREIAIRQHGLEDETDTSTAAIAAALDWSESFVATVLERLEARDTIEQDGDQWRCLR